VHKEVHWCLAIINMKKNTFQYLDSLGGMDHNVLNMLVSICDVSRVKVDLKRIKFQLWQLFTPICSYLHANFYKCQ
jgi:Ulp1 family protease